MRIIFFAAVGLGLVALMVLCMSLFGKLFEAAGNRVQTLGPVGPSAADGESGESGRTCPRPGCSESIPAGVEFCPRCGVTVRGSQTEPIKV